MRYRVLGPVELLDGDGRRPVAAEKERTLLAVLLADAGRPVSTDRLIDALWLSNPPASAAKTLQTYVSHLRRQLGVRLRTTASAYVLDVERDELDASQFEQLVGEARLALLRRDPRASVAAFAAAFELWRGESYAGVDGGALLAAERARLESLRLDALEDSLEARLAIGDRAVVNDLTTMHLAYPLRERVAVLLMRALYHAGRQADALQVYQHTRARLVDELGIEPGPELQAAERAVLLHDVDDGTATKAAPVTAYVGNDSGLQIAYSRLSAGPVPLVFIGDIYMNVELVGELPAVASIFDELSAVGGVIAVQRRGTGASDRERDGSFAGPLDCVGDIDAVLDAEAVTAPAHLVGWGHGGQIALAYAARRPGRVGAVVIVNSYARLSRTDDYDAGYPADALDAWIDDVQRGWGRARSVRPIAGDVGDDPAFIAQLARMERLACSPAEAGRLHRALNDIDVRDLLTEVHSPVLVVHLDRSVSGRRGAQWLAHHLLDARYLELPGHFLPSAPEAQALVAAIREFLATS